MSSAESTVTDADTGADSAVLFYDGRCGLCAGEIARLRRLQRGSLQLRDIHSAEALPPGAPDRDTLLRTLHLRRADGSWLTGADANVEAWRHTRFGWLWAPLRWPLLRTLVDLVYAPWARWRYRRLYGCGESYCER